MTISLEVRGAGRKYQRGWALRNCNLVVRPSSITAVVGPNGAGKSTLMAAAAGLISLTEGAIAVDGRNVNGRMDPALGYLAQDKPLYRRWRVSDLLAQTRDLSTCWDAEHALRLVQQAGLPLEARVGSLSGGQRTRLAVALVLGRRPQLVLLDEPLADLDPLARLEVQQTLMSEVADTGMTVLMSSHILTEVEDTCTSLVLLQAGQVILDGEVDELVADHHLLVGPHADNLDWLPAADRVEVRTTPRQTTVLVTAVPADLPDGWTDESVGLDEIVIARMRAAAAASSTQELAS